MDQKLLELHELNRTAARHFPGLEAVYCLGDGAARQRLESFIASMYASVHNARLQEYLPVLVGLQEADEVCGAFGLKPGCWRPMFLEQYLDLPIEQCVAGIYQQPIDRCDLIEVGNLAISRPGFGPVLMTLLASGLAAAGYKWMVFTVTEQVEHLMGRLGFRPTCLGGADPERLQAGIKRWGTYYENNPRVMVGDLTEARSVVAASPVLSSLAQLHAGEIRKIADRLGAYRIRSGEFACRAQ